MFSNLKNLFPEADFALVATNIPQTTSKLSILRISSGLGWNYCFQNRILQNLFENMSKRYPEISPKEGSDQETLL